MEDARQLKPWEELSEDEKQEIRKSWEVKLPDKFDVFCNDDWKREYDINVPGNLYVNGKLLSINVEKSSAIYVEEDFICESYVECAGLHVGGSCIIDGALDSNKKVEIYGDLIVDAVEVFSSTLTVHSQCTVNGDISCTSIYVCGNLSVYGDVTVLEAGDIFVGNNFTVRGGKIVIQADAFPYGGDITVGNNFSVEGNLDCYDAYILGNAEFFDGINCCDMDIYGSFYCEGSFYSNRSTIRIGPSAFVSLGNL